jgi:predicted transcriptional regulator
MSDPTSSSDSNQDLLARLKHLAQPLVDSIDSRLRDQIDRRVDERVDESLASRLSVIERAIADLDRAVKGLQQREDETGETEAD